MKFVVNNVSDPAITRFVRSLRDMADLIEAGAIKYKSGGAVMGQDDDGIYLSADARFTVVKSDPKERNSDG